MSAPLSTSHDNRKTKTKCKGVHCLQQSLVFIDVKQTNCLTHTSTVLKELEILSIHGACVSLNRRSVLSVYIWAEAVTKACSMNYSH